MTDAQRSYENSHGVLNACHHRDLLPIIQRLSEQTLSVSVPPAVAKLYASEDWNIIPPLLRCFGWQEDDTRANKYSFKAKWPGLKGHARLYRRGPFRYLICVREELKNGKHRVHQMEPARAYAMLHGLQDPSAAALRYWRARLYYDAGFLKPRLQKFRTPSAAQLKELQRRREHRIHFALLEGIRLQQALSEEEYKRFPFSAEWARACSYPRLNEISRDRISRALRDLTAAGLICHKGPKLARRYWLTPARQGEGLTLMQLRKMVA